jgi:hypothetical protein
MTISSDTIAKLRGSVKGRVLTAGDAGYDDARKVWNGDIDRKPAGIVACSGVEDVQASIAFARANGVPIAVRSGGHSMSGQSMADGALVLDMRAMNAVTVDAGAKRARVQGGAVWADVDGATQKHGLAVTGGHVTHTGVAGLTLGGGVGHLHRKLGLVVDNLVSAQVVTADGRVLRASEKENEDLFWAIRGGGGNFGVATEFELKLSEIGPIVLGGLAFWAPDKGPELMRRYEELCKTLPDEVTTILAYLHAPPFDFVPKDVQLTPGYALVAVGTDIEKAQAAIKDIRAFSPPAFDVIGPMPYLAVQGLFDPALPHGTKCYMKAHYLEGFDADTIATVQAQTAKMPPGFSQMICIQMGGAVARVPDEMTAFGGRTAKFQAMFLGIWQDGAQRPACVEWVRGVWGALAPRANRGVYVNLADDLDEATLKATYGAEKYARLQRVKAKYDPENVFHYNQNIPPAK